MSQLFANNASALLAASIDDVETTIQVASGFGVLYPDPGVDQFFLVTLENDDGDIEICRVTARSTDLFTVTRGQEGTAAMAWVQGQTRVELRNTKETMENLLQLSGGAMEGDIDMQENSITDAVLDGPGTKITNGEIVNVPIRGATGAVGNQLTVPVNGTSRAQAGGENIVVAGDIEAEQIQTLAFVIGQIILWYGEIGDIPDGWTRCTGADGTPDLRGRFPLGASGDFAFDSEGGDDSVTSGAGGAHTPVIQGHVLTSDETPVGSHSHRLFVYKTGDSANARAFNTAEGIAGINTGGGALTFGYEDENATGDDLVEASATGGAADAHTHTATAVANHTHTVATMPPYKALHFIMFTGFA